MSLPGFTGDSSLYRSKIPYMMSAAPSPGGPSAEVTPSITIMDTLGRRPRLGFGFDDMGGGGIGDIGDIGGLGGGDIAGTVIPFRLCGRFGRRCCEGGLCEAGLVCIDNVCRDLTCGAAGQPCCPGGRCNPTLECNQNNVCRAPCGAGGQRCCPGGVCDAGLACNANGICRECGGDQDICCPGNTCQSGLACVNGRCTACGGFNQACCGNFCQSGLICANGRCIPCGNFIGDPCCPDFPGGRCNFGRCDPITFTCVP